MAFGDADGFIHLATTTYDETHVPFNGFEGQPVPWPDAPAPLPDIEWDDSTYVPKLNSSVPSLTSFKRPLNMIGMPHYSSQLLSAYTTDLIPGSMSVPMPRKIHPEVLSTMKMTAFVGYAQTPTDLKGKRNVVLPEAGVAEKGRFRSDQSKSKRGATEEEEVRRNLSPSASSLNASPSHFLM